MRRLGSVMVSGVVLAVVAPATAEETPTHVGEHATEFMEAADTGKPVKVEWTAAEAGAKRGAHRVIIEGDPASPNTIYYWNHVNPPVRSGP